MSIEELASMPLSKNVWQLLILFGLLVACGYLLLKAIKSLSENPSEQEIEQAISGIPDEVQRENAKILLFDPHIRETLRELAKAS